MSDSHEEVTRGEVEFEKPVIKDPEAFQRLAEAPFDEVVRGPMDLSEPTYVSTGEEPAAHPGLRLVGHIVAERAVGPVERDAAGGASRRVELDIKRPDGTIFTLGRTANNESESGSGNNDDTERE